MATRRERLRESTIAEIKAAALEQIAEVGAPAMSLRRVARDIGMSPAGLYRYYDGRDDLLTELITDAYRALADAVEHGIAAAGDPPDQRMRGGMRAYRRWSLDHRNQFLLIFGTPIPGYAAPEDGPTVAENRRMGRAFFDVAVEAWQRDEFRPAEPGRSLTAGERALAAEIDPRLPPELVPQMLDTWAHFHGAVTLEVLNQLHWLYGDDAEPFFETSMELLLSSIGFGAN